MRWILFCLCVAVAGTIDVRAADDAQASRQVRVLVVMPDDSAAMNVRIMTTADFATRAVLTGLLPALIDEAVIKKRSAPYEATFAKTMAGFERNAPLAEALAQSFRQRAGGKDVFALTPTTDMARYVKTRGYDTLSGAARAEGFDYVLLLYPQYVGVKTRSIGDAGNGLAAPAYDLTFVLRRVSDDKALHRATLSAVGYWGKPVAEVVSDRAAFTATWNDICKFLAGNLTGELNRTDHLHGMAASAGHGDAVPAIGKLLEAQAKLFSWDLKPVKGWRETKLNTPYARVLEPKDASNAIMGLRFDVDLLVAEFGQDVKTLDEYILVAARRRLELAPEFEPMQKFPDITAPGFDAYSSDSPNGARNIILFRKLDDRRVQMVTAVFLRNHATLYPANRERIEKMLADSAIRLR